MSRQNGRALVVCVDDDVGTLDSLRRCLGSKGIEIQATCLPHRALTWVEERDVAVIISDLYMREMNGISLLEEVHRRRPRTRRVALTGHPDFISVLKERMPGLNAAFTKPWDSRALSTSVLHCIAERADDRGKGVGRRIRA